MKHTNTTKNITLIILTMILLSTMTLADLTPPTIHNENQETNTINMKTNDYYLIQFEVNNEEQIQLKNCVPYIQTSYYDIKDNITFNPEIFDLSNGKKTITTRIQGLQPGRYEAQINVKCERHFQDELQDIKDIIQQQDAPTYEILVSPSGDGQDYVFIPQQNYHFIANPGDTKTATFTIANTGNKPLKLQITPQTEHQEIIHIEPSQTTIQPEQREPITINVEVPKDFKELNTTLNIEIGDYTETFPITGERERILIPGKAVTQNLFTGTTNAGNTKIPNWIILTIIIITGTILLKDEYKPKKNKPRGKN